MGYTRHGLMKLLLSHHPLCDYYVDHVIRIRSIYLCLGCSGFYPSLFLSFAVSMLGILGSNWLFLVSISILLFLPSIIRLFIYVPSRMKTMRFFSKVFLGLAVGLGLYTIIIANNIIIMSLQVIFGLVLYIKMAVQRSNDPNPECGPCNFNPSPVCPGMSPFYDHNIDISLTVEKE